MTYLLLLCLFFSVRFLNMCKPTTSTHAGCLTCIRIYGSELTHLPSWLTMVNAGWVSSMKWEIFSQMKFIIFQSCPTKEAALLFYLGSSFHTINSLFSRFCFFQNAVLQKKLKLGFWMFMAIFLRMQLSFVATFFL